MNKIWIIAKKELASFLYSPIGYVIGFITTGLVGYFFYIDTIYSGFAGMHFTISLLATLSLFTLPLMTMKLVSEEKKRGTIELLMTLPIKTSEIIIGKYFAVLLVFLMILAITFLHFLLILIIGNPEFLVNIGLYFGIILEGMALLSIGIFISTLTDSQVISGLVSIGVGLLLFVINLLSDKVSGIWANIFSEISFGKHLSGFFRGVIDLKDVGFFILITVLGILLSIVYLDNEKWRK
ncbi:MAG TPA: ABC transporter permease [Spirochaetota bacterium]|nr:ABC transporter permease [Spirochaetota bacterium]HOM38321.1 ABC transporter permease [Spirochaetota bacterium]HPQ48461.1 ABC transporter permease [Spirochaetota bacterium]